MFVRAVIDPAGQIPLGLPRDSLHFPKFGTQKIDLVLISRRSQRRDWGDIFLHKNEVEKNNLSKGNRVTFSIQVRNLMRGLAFWSRPSKGSSDWSSLGEVFTGDLLCHHGDVST